MFRFRETYWFQNIIRGKHIRILDMRREAIRIKLNILTLSGKYTPGKRSV